MARLRISDVITREEFEYQKAEYARGFGHCGGGHPINHGSNQYLFVFPEGVCAIFALRRYSLLRNGIKLTGIKRIDRDEFDSMTYDSFCQVIDKMKYEEN